MFAELVFHEISKMDEEVWNAFYLKATSSFLDSEVSKSRRIKNDSKPSNSCSLLHNPSGSTTVCHSQPSRGLQYSLSQDRPSQGQQYSCSQAQQSTLLDSQAHLNMLVWSPPQQLSSSSAACQETVVLLHPNDVVWSRGWFGKPTILLLSSTLSRPLIVSWKCLAQTWTFLDSRQYPPRSPELLPSHVVTLLTNTVKGVTTAHKTVLMLRVNSCCWVYELWIIRSFSAVFQDDETHNFNEELRPAGFRMEEIPTSFTAVSASRDAIPHVGYFKTDVEAGPWPPDS